MKAPMPHRDAHGFTLLEVSVTISLLLMLASALVIMIQQHITFMEMAQRQNFLARDAPQIGSLLGRIFNQADHVFVFASRDDAVSGSNPTIGDGTAVRLSFRGADQATRVRIVSFEQGVSSAQLRFYTYHADGTETSWVITDKIASASFNMSQGILSAVLTGPSGEEVTYSGGPL